MPIAVQELKTTFVLAQETETVTQVLDAWQKSGGQGWWMLLVAKSDGQIVATTLDELDTLLDRFGPALFTARLVDLPLPLTPCVTAEVEAADERMSRGKTLVVTLQGKPIGFMAEAMRSAVLLPSSRRRERLAFKREQTERGEQEPLSFSIQEGFAASSLVELYGEYVKLGEDKRVQWQPAALLVPVQQPCGHTAWPELNDKGKWVCGKCKQPVRT